MVVSAVVVTPAPFNPVVIVVVVVNVLLSKSIDITSPISVTVLSISSEEDSINIGLPQLIDSRVLDVR